MPKRAKFRRTLEDILHGLSEDLFPAELGKAPVTINSRSSDGDTALHFVVREGDAHAVKMLIEAGADVNAIGDMSETPLHVALRKEDLALATALVEAGASGNIVSEFNQTPMDIAIDLGGSFKRLMVER
ncbi:MAG: ankyrin repeat domain-containing protein [Pseudomonadota bacterium]